MTQFSQFPLLISALEEWVAVVGASDLEPLDQETVRRWLQAEHGVRRNSQSANDQNG